MNLPFVEWLVVAAFQSQHLPDPINLIFLNSHIMLNDLKKYQSNFKVLVLVFRSFYIFLIKKD